MCKSFQSAILSEISRVYDKDLIEKKVSFFKEIHNDDFAIVKLCFSDLNVFYRFGEGV